MLEPEERHGDRRRRVGSAADREIGQRDAVEPVLVAAERGKDRLAEIRDVADGRLESRIRRYRRPRQPERRRQARPGHQQHRFAAEARAEAADRRRIDVVAPLRVGKEQVERRGHRQRPQRLQREEITQVKDQVDDVADVVQHEIRSDPRIAVERRGHDVAEAREHRDRVDVIVRDRAPHVAVREGEQRKSRRRIGPQRRLGAALHVGHAAPGRQRVVRPRIARRGRIADQHDVRDGAPGERAVDVAVVRRVDDHRKRIRGIGEEVGDVARRAVGARHAFPVRLHVLARREPAEVLRDVAAGDRIGTRKRQRREHERRIGTRERGDDAEKQAEDACRAGTRKPHHLASNRWPRRRPCGLERQKRRRVPATPACGAPDRPSARPGPGN